MQLTRLPISVIIPCYNCAETIHRAVDSVIAQTELPSEIILIDDCSDDNSLTINAIDNIQKQYQDYTIVVIKMQVNSGPASARNIGWDFAKQPYLAFLDSDDTWHPKKLSIQYAFMKNNSDVVMSAHKSVIMKKSNEYKIDLKQKHIHKIGKIRILFFNFIPTRTVMLKKDINYRFLPDKRYAEDYLLWLMIILSGQSAYFIDCPMALSYKHEYGEAGLTKSLSKNLDGVLDTYKRIFKKQFINFAVYILVVLFAYISHVRRLLVKLILIKSFNQSN